MDTFVQYQFTFSSTIINEMKKINKFIQKNLATNFIQHRFLCNIKEVVSYLVALRKQISFRLFEGDFYIHNSPNASFRNNLTTQTKELNLMYNFDTYKN